MASSPVTNIGMCTFLESVSANLTRNYFKYKTNKSSNTTGLPCHYESGVPLKFHNSIQNTVALSLEHKMSKQVMPLTLLYKKTTLSLIVVNRNWCDNTFGHIRILPQDGSERGIKEEAKMTLVVCWIFFVAVITIKVGVNWEALFSPSYWRDSICPLGVILKMIDMCQHETYVVQGCVYSNYSIEPGSLTV